MPNYQNSRIYSIRSYQTDDMYIGSTTQPLCKRMAEHRKDYKRWKNGKCSYTSSFEILKYGDAYIELLEARSCKNKEELRLLEASYIRNRQCVNKVIPDRSKKQWYIDNKEQLDKKRVQYRIKNKERISKQTAQYRIDNKKQIYKYQAQYYIANKAKLQAKTDCPCGGRHTHHNKARHLKSKMHQKYIASTDTTNNI